MFTRIRTPFADSRIPWGEISAELTLSVFRLARDIYRVVCAYHCAACDKQFKPKVKAKSLDGPR
jgi:hypothetical protein